MAVCDNHVLQICSLLHPIVVQLPKSPSKEETITARPRTTSPHPIAAVRHHTIITPPQSFSELADLLDTTGLLPALADFRGTIFAPTNDAIKEAQSVVMDKVETEELSEEEAIEALKNVVLYHLVPDAAVFSGSVATGRLQLNTGLGEPQKLDEFCKLLVSCLATLCCCHLSV